MNDMIQMSICNKLINLIRFERRETEVSSSLPEYVCGELKLCKLNINNSDQYGCSANERN